MVAGGPEGGDSTAEPPETQSFGTAGWVLLAGVFVAFVVVPTIIAVRPPGLPFRVAYLVLPLAPAVLLALLAVWVTARR